MLPARRPVRPIRWRNEDTVAGASIWITRSRSPTSIPSSSELVATITQFCRWANACSAWRRSSTPRELWETNVSTLLLPQEQGQLFDPGTAVAEDQPFLALVQRPDDLGGIGERAHVVDLDLGLLPVARQGLDDLPRLRSDPQDSHSSISAGFPTVADSPTRWMSRPASLWMRERTDSKCQPRSSPANA